MILTLDNFGDFDFDDILGLILKIMYIVSKSSQFSGRWAEAPANMFVRRHSYLDLMLRLTAPLDPNWCTPDLDRTDRKSVV